MANEKSYQFSFKHSETRELQLALLYHLDNVLIPYLEETARHQDYTPTEEIRKRIKVLQGILKKLNREAGPYKERE